MLQPAAGPQQHAKSQESLCALAMSGGRREQEKHGEARRPHHREQHNATHPEEGCVNVCGHAAGLLSCTSKGKSRSRFNGRRSIVTSWVTMNSRSSVPPGVRTRNLA
jgi:hypothetical protein